MSTSASHTTLRICCGGPGSWSAFPSPSSVMLLSSERDVKDRARGLPSQPDEYVGKPYDPTHLLRRARELVRLPVPELGHAAVVRARREGSRAGTSFAAG